MNKTLILKVTEQQGVPKVFFDNEGFTREEIASMMFGVLDTIIETEAIEQIEKGV